MDIIDELIWLIIKARYVCAFVLGLMMAVGWAMLKLWVWIEDGRKALRPKPPTELPKVKAPSPPPGPK